MTRITVFFVVCCVLFGCRSGRHAVRPVPVTDSVRVEYRVEYRERIDTAWVDVPVETVRVFTVDTFSRITGRYAVTTASVQGGRLLHTLQPTGAKMPVETVTVERVRDSIVYRSREVPVEVPVEVRRTPRAVRWMAVGFWVLLAGLAFRIARMLA